MRIPPNYERNLVTFLNDDLDKLKLNKVENYDQEIFLNDSFSKESTIDTAKVTEATIHTTKDSMIKKVYSSSSSFNEEIDDNDDDEEFVSPSSGDDIEINETLDAAKKKG